MRIIPVLDLRHGVAVHAVRGERQQYRPVQSILAPTAEPLAVSRGFQTRLGLDELYVADLDAICEGRPQRDLIVHLARGRRALVDAAVSDVAGARRLLADGVDRVVIGSETLSDGAALAELPLAVPPARLVFSLDLRAGAILSPETSLASADPLDVLEALATAGWREVILLDLARVGSGAGPELRLLEAARRRCPDLRILAGGGVRGADDLRSLERLGIAGALVGTALHRGAITVGDLRDDGHSGIPDREHAGPSPARRRHWVEEVGRWQRPVT